MKTATLSRRTMERDVAGFGAGISCLNGAFCGCTPQKDWKIREGRSPKKAPNNR